MLPGQPRCLHFCDFPKLMIWRSLPLLCDCSAGWKWKKWAGFELCVQSLHTTSLYTVISGTVNTWMRLSQQLSFVHIQKICPLCVFLQTLHIYKWIHIACRVENLYDFSALNTCRFVLRIFLCFTYFQNGIYWVWCLVRQNRKIHWRLRACGGYVSQFCFDSVITFKCPYNDLDCKLEYFKVT